MTRAPTEVRFSVVIERELNQRLDKVCPWGIKAATVRKVIEMLVELGEGHGKIAIALLLDGKLEIKAKKGVYALQKGGQDAAR